MFFLKMEVLTSPFAQTYSLDWCLWSAFVWIDYMFCVILGSAIIVSGGTPKEVPLRYSTLQTTPDSLGRTARAARLAFATARVVCERPAEYRRGRADRGSRAQ